MSGHFELGELIKNHKDSDIGEFQLLHQFTAIAGFVLSGICHLFTITNFHFFSLNNQLNSASISSCHICLFLLLTCKPHHNASYLSSSVPFLESPKYVPRRKESSHTLPLPSLHSHPLLRANSDNTMTQSDPLALPNKAATNPNSGQVHTIRWICWSTLLLDMINALLNRLLL